jgi:D-glycero-D-manno-heptose 1,7-bisphosphate phosphatase
MRKAVFLDRDGVINRKAREGEYVTRWEEMEILPGVPAAITLLNQSGMPVIVVSNQRCVAKGLITDAALGDLHRRMCDALALAGATIDAIYYCPHEAEPPCACRKPQPGMLFDAARDHDIDLSNSWMIGDSQADVEAGKNAGCKTAMLANNPSSRAIPDRMASSLLEATRQILAEQDIAVTRQKQTGKRHSDLNTAPQAPRKQNLW